MTFFISTTFDFFLAIDASESLPFKAQTKI